MKKNTTITVTLSALAFLLLSAGVAYASTGEGFQRFGEISEEQRALFEEARALRQEGDKEGAHALLEEAGFDMGRQGERHPEMSAESRERHDAIRAAIEAGDYDAFLEVIDDAPHDIDLDEDTFNKLVEAHALRMDGDHNGARAIMEEIGFPRGPMLGHGKGRMHDDDDNQ